MIGTFPSPLPTCVSLRYTSLKARDLKGGERGGQKEVAEGKKTTWVEREGIL